MSDASPAGFYDQRQIGDLLRLSRWSVWRMVKDGEFPPPVKLTKQRVGWPRAQVDQWIASRSSAPDQQAA